MYSPGSLNVAVMAALPVNVTFGAGAVKSAFCGDNRGLLNVTVPGPRNLVQVRLTGGKRESRGLAPGTRFASSAANTVIESGCETVACILAVTARGPNENGPDSANPTYGGVLPVAST